MSNSAPSTHEILVVEDDPFSRDLLVMMLKSADIQVTAACDGQDAADIIQSRPDTPFETVFTDVQMPRMDGLQLLEWLNTHSPDTATVVMTASQERDIVSASLRGGAVEFLDKPFDLRTVLRSVKHARQTHERRHAQAEAARRLLDIANINQRLTSTALGSGRHQAPDNLSLSTRFYAINEAGGDMVKANLLDQNRLLLVLGDVSGHGLKEGFLSAYFQGIIEGMAHQSASPQSIAQAFNHFLCNQWNDHDTMAISTSLSACFLEVNLAAHQLSILNCGSPGVILSDRQGRTTELAPGGTPLGWFTDIDPIRHTTPIDTGGHIQLWSDGLEDHAAKLAVPPMALAYRLLHSAPNTLAQTLLKDATDDIVTCRLEWNTPDPDGHTHPIWTPIHQETHPGDSAPHIDILQTNWEKILTFTLPNLHPDTLHDITLCVREAALNALDHGCKHDPARTTHIELLVDEPAQTLLARITDDGIGFDPTVAPANLDPDHISLGLQLMRALTRSITHSPDGRSIELAFNLKFTNAP